jgi:hypothetical protein
LKEEIPLGKSKTSRPQPVTPNLREKPPLSPNNFLIRDLIAPSGSPLLCKISVATGRKDSSRRIALQLTDPISIPKIMSILKDRRSHLDSPLQIISTIVQSQGQQVKSNIVKDEAGRSAYFYLTQS